jgi:hypothetical protein
MLKVKIKFAIVIKANLSFVFLILIINLMELGSFTFGIAGLSDLQMRDIPLLKGLISDTIKLVKVDLYLRLLEVLPLRFLVVFGRRTTVDSNFVGSGAVT